MTANFEFRGRESRLSAIKKYIFSDGDPVLGQRDGVSII